MFLLQNIPAHMDFRNAAPEIIYATGGKGRNYNTAPGCSGVKWTLVMFPLQNILAHMDFRNAAPEIILYLRNWGEGGGWKYSGTAPKILCSHSVYLKFHDT